MKKDKFIIAKPGSKIKLSNYDPGYTAGYKNKKEAEGKLIKDVQKLSELQDKLYAQNKYSLLIIFQAMDAAGKDGTIKHVMSGINPQGCQVYSFKQPSAEELGHDYLWRTHKVTPECGKIGIFDRSYYEEVLITKVHPELLSKQHLPNVDTSKVIPGKFWKNRYEQINNFEKHLVENGTIIIKFFLNLSKEEQRKRFLERINDTDKNWKFTISDIEERKYWEQYQQAFQETINKTSTEYAPWHIIPADNKWFMRTAVGDIIVDCLKGLNLSYPRIDNAKKMELIKAKELLENEA